MPRRKPKKFVRPSVDLDHHGKVWQDMRAEQVRVGDVVTNFGQVAEVMHTGHGIRHVSVAGASSLRVPDSVLRVFGPPR